MPKYTAMIDTVDETNELYLLVCDASDIVEPYPKYQWKLNLVVEAMIGFKRAIADVLGPDIAKDVFTNAMSPDAGMPQRGVKGK